MKKVLILTLSLVALCITMTGCGNSYMGSDSKVKKLVLEIVEEQLRDKMTSLIYTKVIGFPAEMADFKVTYKNIQEKSSSNKDAEKIIKLVDEAMKKLTITLENVRVDEVDKDAKKSISSANFVVNGESSPIRYMAQINADGELYVEVYGL